MKISQFPCARKTGLVVQDMPDEVLVYDLESNKAHCLNGSAALVWRSCDGKTSISDIASLFEDQTGNKVSEEFVWLAIDQLNETALLESEVKSAFVGRSRRDVIKKIGLASVVAVPIIASLVAPSSVFAASSCSCMNDLDCAAQAPQGCGTTCDTAGSGLCIA